MEISFPVKITAKDMFIFLLRHSYRGASLVVNLLITVGAFALFFTGLGTDEPLKSFMLLFLALLFSVVYPMQLLFRARRQVKKNPVFKEPLWYTLNEEGIKMTQGEMEESFTWENIFQVRSMGSILAVYTSRVYACIWPKAAFAEKNKEVQEMLAKHLSEKVYKR